MHKMKLNVTPSSNEEEKIWQINMELLKGFKI